MMNRMMKWVAAGALALGSVPAIGLARHVSLPTEGAITVTPTSLATPVAAKQVSRTSAAKKKIAAHRKVQARKHTTRARATHKRVVHKAARKPAASHRKVVRHKRVPARHAKSA